MNAKSTPIRILDTPWGLRIARYVPLWWQTAGLQESASGYGAKLTTPWKIQDSTRRLRRVYATCYGNGATLWVGNARAVVRSW